MTYTALMQICMWCFPDLFVSEGEISYLSYYWHRTHEASITDINLMRLCVEEPKYECMSEGASEHACSLVILGMIACTHTQSRVDCSRTQWLAAGPGLCMSVLSRPIWTCMFPYYSGCWNDDNTSIMTKFKVLNGQDVPQKLVLFLAEVLLL